jgi:hypothetical protein
MAEIEFDSIIFREGNTFVSYSPRLDISSCGNSVEEAKKNLMTAVRLFLEESEKMGTLEEILGEAGYERTDETHWMTPRLVATELMSIET